MAASDHGYRARIEQLAADNRAQREQWLPRLPAELRALLPLDATPLTEGLELLADGAGIGDEVATALRRESRVNAAVLHGRVFGRAEVVPLATAHAAFADGARVRERLIARVAEAIDGAGLRREAEALLAAAPVPPPEAFADGDPALRLGALEAAFAAQEHALLHCAARLDAIVDG